MHLNMKWLQGTPCIDLLNPQVVYSPLHTVAQSWLHTSLAAV